MSGATKVLRAPLLMLNEPGFGATTVVTSTKGEFDDGDSGGEGELGGEEADEALGGCRGSGRAGVGRLLFLDKLEALIVSATLAGLAKLGLLDFNFRFKVGRETEVDSEGEEGADAVRGKAAKEDNSVEPSRDIQT